MSMRRQPLNASGRNSSQKNLQNLTELNPGVDDKKLKKQFRSMSPNESRVYSPTIYFKIANEYKRITDNKKKEQTVVCDYL